MATVAQRILPFAHALIAALLTAAGIATLPANAHARTDSIPPPSNLHRARIAISPNPQKISTLTVLPNSVQLEGNAAGIAWRLDTSRTRIAFIAPLHRYGDTVGITFRTINLPLRNRFSASQLSGLLSPDSALTVWQPESPPQPPSPPPPPIVIKGVAERALGMGSLAYAAPTSGMINLSILGPLHGSTRFETHIVDNSLPFQPDGTSARIDRINRLFLRVYDSAWRIEAGDVGLEEARGHFLRQREDAMGVRGAWRGKASAWDSLALCATLGFAKGEIERTDIRPIEGIQGPYALLGAHAFAQVVVRAGTERIFLDGELLTRGDTHDYTIDYNLGSITFTARRPIHRLSRIVAEYETTKRSYTRLLGHISAETRHRNGWRIGMKAYLAQDRAASLPAELKEAGALQLLAQTPTHPPGARVLLGGKRIDGKTNSGYIATDTTRDGQKYTIYLYQPAGRHDTLLSIPFTYVGPNRGDYQLTQREYNDRVFRWVAPVNNAPQGDYTPGIQVPPPRGHAMVESTIAKRWEQIPADVSLTAAYSLLDGNTLSRSNKRQSYAIEFAQNARLASYQSGGLYIHTRARWVAKDFAPINRFLPVEFSRAWGEGDARAFAPWADAATSITSRTRHSHARIKGEMLWRPYATAWRGTAEATLKLSGWECALAATTLLRNADSARATRGSIVTSAARAFPYVRIQGNAASEWLIPLRYQKALRIAPYAFAEGGITVALTDTLAAKASLRATYRRTWDTAARGARLEPRADALESTLETRAPIGEHGFLKGCASARATFPTKTYREAPRGLNLLASLDYSQALALQRVQLNARFALSSELLPKWQMHFIPVPIGQGTHEWIDANRDGKPQLDEFLPAQHADRALFVKQMVASSEQQKALSTITSLELHFSPRANLQPIEAPTPWWQRFDISISLEHSAKRTDGRIIRLLNPLDASDAATMPERTRAIRIEATLNKNAAPLFVTYSSARADNRQTIAQGVNANATTLHSIALETPPHKGIGGRLRGEYSQQKQQRPYAARAIETLTSRLAEATLIWRTQREQTHGFSATFCWIALGPKRLRVESQRYEYKLEMPLVDKWTITAQASYSRVSGDSLRGHALAYQALKGDSNGNNLTAQATVSYKITEHITLNLTYSLRKNGLSPAINAGFATLRAAF